MIYLDNAATTITDPEVIDIMATVMNNFFGNPSSAHEPGYEASTILEESRKTISGIVNCHADELFFTSGGTEAINLVFYNMGLNAAIKHVITSPLEHPAVLHSLDKYGLSEKTEFLNILPDATPDLDQLETMLKEMPGAFVSLMHVNNECGSMLDVKKTGALCKQYGALFFCDTVQAIGKTEVDLHGWGVDFAACSGHKFHGPRGIGFLYKNRKHSFIPQMAGGGQEKGLRSGTENTAAIAGLCRALELSEEHFSETTERILSLKHFLIETLRNEIPGILFAGDTEKTLPHIVSIAVSETENNLNLQQVLNKAGFAVSAGSACHAGSKTSALLYAVGLPGHYPLRVSFGKFSTMKETALFAEQFIQLFAP
jgi:cysteine desulfurase